MRAALSAALLLASAPALADWTPVQLGPGGPIVEQDWGLYRPGHGTPRLRDGPILMTVPRPMALPANLQPYFPTGVLPGDQPEPKAATPPKPAEPYFRQWSTPTPPDLAPPPEGPTVIYAPPLPQGQPPLPPSQPRPRAQRNSAPPGLPPLPSRVPNNAPLGLPPK